MLLMNSNFYKVKRVERNMKKGIVLGLIFLLSITFTSAIIGRTV